MWWIYLVNFLHNVIAVILPLIGTFILGWIAWKFWVHYVQQNFISGIEWVLLEIIPPREVLRSPMGMELFITNALYHKSKKGFGEEYWQGAVWFWFSLEIVSIDGQVHFYVRVPTRVKHLVETQMYAQYPQSQVKVVEDYTLAVDEITPKSDWNLWGCEFKLIKPEVYPLKTYVAFGLDEDPKEEYKVDPISSVIELFGSMGKGEQMWSQIVLTAARKKYKAGEKLFKHHDWVKEGEVLLKERLKDFTRYHPRDAQFGGGYSMEIRSPGFLDEMVKGAASKILKVGFDCGIRVCYVAKKESFNANHRRSLRLIWRQYAAPFSNQLERYNSTQADFYSGFIPTPKKLIMRLCNRMLNEYRERAFFYLPLRHIYNRSVIPWWLSLSIFPAFFHHHTFILNTEELATLWHFPGQILKVPTLERIESKEASPPPNLPI